MRVLVTGAAGPAGRSLLDQLGERAIAAVGCDLSPSPRPDGVRVHQVPAATDPRFVPALATLAARERADLVIPTVSEELPVLSRAGLERTLIGPPAAVETAADKLLTARALAAAGVAVPFTFAASEMNDGAARLVGVPYLTKPRVGRGGRGVRVHESWPPPVPDDHVVCELAPGQEYCVQVHVPGDGRSVAIVLRKTALREGRHGNAVGVEVVEVPAVAAVGLAACRALGLTGPADVDVRRRADGTPAVLEVNARFGAHSAAAPAVLDAVLAGAREEPVGTSA